MNSSRKNRYDFVQNVSDKLDSLLYSNYNKSAKYSVKTESGLVELELMFNNGLVCVTKARLIVNSKVIEKSRIVYKDYVKLSGNFSNLNTTSFPDCLLGYDTTISLARSIDRLNLPCDIEVL